MKNAGEMICEIERLELEMEKLKLERERLLEDRKVIDEVLDYISKGVEKVAQEWGREK